MEIKKILNRQTNLSFVSTILKKGTSWGEKKGGEM